MAPADRVVSGTVETAEPTLAAIIDPQRRQIGCVLVQAVFGGDPAVCHLFDSRLWATAPTETMRGARGTRSDWEALASAWSLGLHGAL